MSKKKLTKQQQIYADMAAPTADDSMYYVAKTKKKSTTERKDIYSSIFLIIGVSALAFLLIQILTNPSITAFFIHP